MKSDDGFSYIATNHTSVYNWSNNATGILIEGNDSIEFFRIIMNPREDLLTKILFC